MQPKHSFIGVSVFLVALSPLCCSRGLADGSAKATVAKNARSLPIYRVKAEYAIPVKTRDGVLLSTDVYRPDAVGQFPVLLVRTPYDNYSPYYIERAKFFAARGYVVVIQDTRGRYDSEGEFYPFLHEANDGYDTQEWAGTQPWSNGKVGTFGGSYLGATQWLPAPLGNRHLKAMAPNIVGADYYHDWVYPGGGLSLSFAAAWGIVQMGSRTKQPPQFAVLPWEQALKHLPLADLPRHLGRRVPFFDDWIAHPSYDDYWKRWSNWENYDKISVPVLNISGWFDSFLTGTFTNYERVVRAAKSDAVQRSQRLLIGPWLHGDIDYHLPSKVGEIDFGPSASVDLYEVHLRWFDYWLKGIENGVGDEPPIRIFVMGDNRWREEWHWPLPQTRYSRLYLSSSTGANSLYGDGLLSLTLPLKKGRDEYLYDPEYPVPSAGGNGCCWPEVVAMGPYDQRPVELRHDVLVYSTEPLEQDVEVTGPVVAEIYASSSGKDTDFTAKLVDVHPNGYAQFITDGILRGRYRESKGNPTLIEPGKIQKYRIDLRVTSNVFKKGHRIRAEISSSNFPRYDRNLNTGGQFGIDSKTVRAQQIIYHGPDHPSSIILPIIPSPESKPGSNPGGRERGPPTY